MSRLDTDIMLLRTTLISAIHNLTNFISVLNELDDIRIAIEDLAHGQLSPILLPPEILESTLTEINTELRHRLRVSTSVTILLENTPAAYYRSHNFVAVRQGANLLIAVNFPLSIDNLDMTLYKVQTFPLPVPGNKFRYM